MVCSTNQDISRLRTVFEYKPEYKTVCPNSPSLARTLINCYKKPSKSKHLSIKFSRIHLVLKLDLTNLVDLSHRNKPPNTMVSFVPLHSKPIITRSEAEEGTIEAEEEDPSRVQIPQPLVPTPALPFT